MKARSVFGYLVRFALGLVAGTLLFEAYLRMAEATPIGRVLPVAEVAPYGPSAETGYMHRPGVSGMWITESRAHLQINSLGLRDKLERTLMKPDGVRRYAIVGDSVVEALQVPLEATFVALTEHALERVGQRVEVVNLGLAGATPAVIMQRLKAEVPRLGVDGAVVDVALGELLSDRPDNSSEYPGFVPSADGGAMISDAFRDSPGFRFRASPTGKSIYWAIDHVRLVLVLNNRKNAGLLAELPQSPARPGPPRACRDATLEAAEAVFTGKPHGFANARVGAFLAGISEIGRHYRIPVVLAVRGLDNSCGENGGLRERVAAMARLQAATAGLRFVDLDEAVRSRLNGEPARQLYGFGVHFGQGHLNEHGHRVFAAVFEDVIRRELIGAR